MNVLKTKSDTSNGQPGDWTVETKPWLRRRRESRVAYAAAQVYFELPGKRSIEEAARRCKKHESLLGVGVRNTIGWSGPRRTTHG